MPSESDSSEPERRKKKKRKEEKKEKAAKREKGDKKAGRRKDQPPGSEEPSQPRRAARPAEDFGASGLLGGAEDAASPPPPGGAAGAPRQRSRSRDEPPRLRLELRDSDGKGKGKGKGKEKGDGPPEPEVPKEQPNFEASGLLAVEDNSKGGIPLKFTNPPEARMPKFKWRLYVFTKEKRDEPFKILHIHRQLAVLFGKDRRVADVPTDHPTCSKQHAVLHYRMTPSGDVKPYIMDLESVNGTFLNGDRIESARYYEMREGDVLKFGSSTREFVLLHGASANHIGIDPNRLMSPD